MEQGNTGVVARAVAEIWNNGDLADRTGLGEYLASRGVVMPTLNFRHSLKKRFETRSSADFNSLNTVNLWTAIRLLPDW